MKNNPVLYELEITKGKCINGQFHAPFGAGFTPAGASIYIPARFCGSIFDAITFCETKGWDVCHYRNRLAKWEETGIMPPHREY